MLHFEDGAPADAGPFFALPPNEEELRRWVLGGRLSWKPRERFTNFNENFLALAKYGYGASSIVQPGEREVIVRFDQADTLPPTNAAFLTPNSFTNLNSVEELLSLTYQPRYRYEWLTDQIQEGVSTGVLELCSVYGHPGQFNRVWPAFDRRGGGWEVVLTGGALNAPAPRFLETGDDQDHRMDATALDQVPNPYLRRDLQEGFFEALQPRFEPPPSPPSDETRPYEGEPRGAAKVQPGGVAATVTAGPWYLTLSSTYHDDGTSVEIRLYAVYWRDLLRWRIFSHPRGSLTTTFSTGPGIGAEDLRNGEMSDEIRERVAEFADTIPNPGDVPQERWESFQLPSPYLDQDYYTRPGWIGLG